MSLHMLPIMAWKCETGVSHIYIDSPAEVFLFPKCHNLSCVRWKYSFGFWVIKRLQSRLKIPANSTVLSFHANKKGLLTSNKTSNLWMRLIFCFLCSESTCGGTCSSVPSVTWSYDTSLTLLPAWWQQSRPGICSTLTELIMPDCPGWTIKIWIWAHVICEPFEILWDIFILLQTVDKVSGFWNEKNVCLHQALEAQH